MPKHLWPSKEEIFEQIANPLFQQGPQTKESLLQAIKNAGAIRHFLAEPDNQVLFEIGEILRRKTYTDQYGDRVNKYIHDDQDGTWTDNAIEAHLGTRNPEEPNADDRKWNYLGRHMRSRRRKQKVARGINKTVRKMFKREERVKSGEVFEAPSLWDTNRGQVS